MRGIGPKQDLVAKLPNDPLSDITNTFEHILEKLGNSEIN